MKVRRSVGVVAALAASLGLPPVAAEAGPATGSGQLQMSYSAQVSSAGCGMDMNADTPVVGLSASGAWQTVKGSAIGSMAQFRPVADATARARIVTGARGGVRVDLAVDAVTEIYPSGINDGCTVKYGLGGAVESTVSVPVSSWAVARGSAKVQGGSSSNFEAVSPDRTVRVVGSLGYPSTRLVPAGSFSARLWLSPNAVSAGPVTTVRASVNGTGTVAFVPIGTRRTLSGTGTGLISVGHRDCGRNRVVASFSSAARTRLRSATFAVDGQRRVVLRGRQLQRSSLVLGSIARTGAGKVSVQMVLKSGARRVTASTSWPCA